MLNFLWSDNALDLNCSVIKYYKLKQLNMQTVFMQPSQSDQYNIFTAAIPAPKVISFAEQDDLTGLYRAYKLKYIVINNAHLCTEAQINTLKQLSSNIDIYCYGLKDSTSDSIKYIKDVADKTLRINI